MQQEDDHAEKPGSCRPCAARVRHRVIAKPAPVAGAGLVACAGGHGQVHAGTRREPCVPARRQKKQWHVPMVPVLPGSEAKHRGEGRGSEKQRTLGSERGKESKRESATFLSSTTRHPSSVPPRPSARRLAQNSHFSRRTSRQRRFLSNDGARSLSQAHRTSKESRSQAFQDARVSCTKVTVSWM